MYGFSYGLQRCEMYHCLEFVSTEDFFERRDVEAVDLVEIDILACNLLDAFYCIDFSIAEIVYDYRFITCHNQFYTRVGAYISASSSN